MMIDKAESVLGWESAWGVLASDTRKNSLKSNSLVGKCTSQKNSMGNMHTDVRK